MLLLRPLHHGGHFGAVLPPKSLLVPLQARVNLCTSTQARSQDLEKGGGLFWKNKKCANDLDSNFHWSWISFRRFVQNLRRNVSEKSEIHSFFPRKVGWSPKKKKGLRQNSEWFFGRNPKFKGFFRPKLGGLQKKNKKKRSSPKFRVIFRPKSEIQRFFPPKIRWSPKKKQKKNKKKRSSPKFRVIFRPKSEIQSFFPPKIRWSPKKKKKKKVFAKIQSDFSAEIRNSKVFSAQN